ncbi:glycosyltransferase family 2 protein [Paludibacterium paludis]|uniref:Glycosyltransferase 2-like domain-containing protein n=1 Tax=Paludibacterium paludis TaxID=1225769 RepID=A0A918P7R1_9NEIS|nr:glycosyltransferase [Paludibacterium paludis]GGY29696.1 hypothetical protein GCM10011289_35770 [Paludibacterium paludis]
MIDPLLPEEGFHLDMLLILNTYLDQVGSHPAEANSQLSRALGVDDSPIRERILLAFQLVASLRLPEAARVLKEVGLENPDWIPHVYPVLAMVFKYITSGPSVQELATFGIEPVMAFYRQYPDHPEAQRALIDMLLYFGRLESLSTVLAQADLNRFVAEVGDYQQLRYRLDNYRDRCRLSIVLVTWQRPEHLRHTLERLKAALWCDDVEIVIGVNDDWQATLDVITQFGIDKVRVNDRNGGINFYKEIFPLAEGEYLIEIDDDIEAFPHHFDKDIIEALQSDASLGYVGHWPQRYLLQVSGRQLPGLEPMHLMTPRLGKPFGIGPVSGACAGMRRKDFVRMNGFGRATLSSQSGEEMQIIRKLSLYGMVSGVFFDQGLEVRVVGE